MWLGSIDGHFDLYLTCFTHLWPSSRGWGGVEALPVLQAHVSSNAQLKAQN